MPGQANVKYHMNPRDLASILVAHSMSPHPTVLHFFNKACPGCKAMHPKLLQIVRDNSDFTFHEVRCNLAAAQPLPSSHSFVAPLAAAPAACVPTTLYNDNLCAGAS